MELLEGDAGWNGLSRGADLRQCIVRLIFCPRNVVKLTALKRAAELLNEEAVACHVAVPGIPFARDLLSWSSFRDAKTMPAPSPVRIFEPSKCIHQCVESGGGGSNWVSAQSTKKSATT